ncbi:putative membrane protein [Helicobacter pylori Hp M9]|nr:putative membrane protein [Helicobacter pylori Hp H-24b]EJC42409.1 putative membrane protein [Helicobacter pylori Hp M4]EJC59423.1 putative membrane protein [Helicobacter pylori Hp M9]
MFFQSCFLSDFIVDCLFLFRGLFFYSFILLFFYSFILLFFYSFILLFFFGGFYGFCVLDF